MDTPPFQDWKRAILASAGTASGAVSALGDPALELFFRRGCEPTLSGLLSYAVDGLRPTYESRTRAQTEQPEARP